ncbi:endonuclease/exonuclease/phosphatase family protein [Dyadobacter tibetensis]|uniref:endonuclease/exonuclease/phosphatase family protein n=1 Tax=Dyadobacter tibetensis TaxID=1211851 RepID=UPI000470E573|nr:endonuclease/exonuclease/phosphatase family protein [Dyadobacter tibetensis]
MRKLGFILLLTLFTTVTASAQKSSPLTIASYNLRYNNAGDGVNAWPNRKEEVKALIRYHDFDLMGTQEALRGQLDDVAELPVYAYVGKGRDDGKQGGEHSAIFYKKDRFKLIKNGDFWLSETPDTPGKGWDATCCNRITSWAQFKDLITGKTFYFFNTHFDHQGVTARKESGKLIAEKVKEIAGKDAAILTGDFNSTPETEQIKTIGSLLQDAYSATEQAPYGPVGTFNSFKFEAAMDKRIDYIFVSKQVRVLKYAVLTDSKNQRYPSDHQPVVIKAIIK